jgi:uncharacterized DUF497 family protein
MIFNWNEEKNQLLISERGVSFEMVVAKIAKGEIIDLYGHPNSEKYPNQFIFIVELKNYLYCVPFTKQGENIFLKTIFPSRKATKTYPGKHHEQTNK